jgi:hypothetical protein
VPSRLLKVRVTVAGAPGHRSCAKLLRGESEWTEPPPAVEADLIPASRPS